MIRFNNDYNHGAVPAILDTLVKYNDEGYGGYGMDNWCDKAAEEILKQAEAPEAQVHFLVGGTQTNSTFISSVLRPYQSVISADTGHINAHETGAIESSGHKVETIDSEDGIILAPQIAALAENYRTSNVQEHITQPKMVYLSFPSELGTLYTKEQLIAIAEVCKEYGMYLFLDGARLSYGLTSEKCNVTLADIARLTDAFYIGGTKCGALFGEALVITNPELKEGFRSSMKQNGAMLAKGWLLGLQFYTLLKDGLYYDIARQANEYAMKIRQAFESEGIPAKIDSYTNQQFFVLDDRQKDYLAKNYIFDEQERIDDDHTLIRICTSWSTTREDVEALISNVERL